MAYQESLEVFIREAREVDTNIRLLLQKKLHGNFGELAKAVASYWNDPAENHRASIIDACSNAKKHIATQIALVEIVNEKKLELDFPTSTNAFVQLMNNTVMHALQDVNSLHGCLQTQESILIMLVSSLNPSSPRAGHFRALFSDYKMQLKEEIAIYKRIQQKILALQNAFANPVHVAPRWTETDDIRLTGGILAVGSAVTIGAAAIASMPILGLGAVLSFLLGTNKMQEPRTPDENELRRLHANLELKRAKLDGCVQLLSNMLVTLKRK